MREVEFLPSWYPALQRRRRVVLFQAWLTLALILLMTGITIARRLDVRRQETAAIGLERQINFSDRQIAWLDKLLAQQNQLINRQVAIDQLGLNVGGSRLMDVLEDVTPAKITLTSLSVETTDPAAGNRRLNVRMQGVAPNDTQTTVLLGKLNAEKFLSDVTLTSLRDRNLEGHSMREFEASFAIKIAGDK